MIFNFALCFFCIFVQASQSLLIPFTTAVAVTDYKEASLVFILQPNGGFCLQYKNNHEKLIRKGVKALPDDLKISNKSKAIKDYPLDRTRFIKYFPFPRNFWDYIFLNFSFYKAIESLTIRDANSNLSNFCMSYFARTEIYQDDVNEVLYCLNNQNVVQYIDLLPLSNKYEYLFEPIKNINDAHCLNVVLIWNNLFIFLKNYFYNAYNNQRLKHSLHKIFLTNAGVVFMHLLALYYGTILFLLSRSNTNLMILIKLAAGMHFTVHAWYNYARLTKQN